MNADGPADKVTRLLYEPSDVSFAYRLVTTPAASQLRFAFACRPVYDIPPLFFVNAETTS